MNETSILILSAQQFPKPRWNSQRNVFELISTENLSFHSDAKDKCQLWLDRYYLIYQRLKRSATLTKDGWKLTPLDSLLGSPGKKLVLGLLCQLKEGVYYLEDPKANVPLDLSETIFSPGLFVEGMFVLAEGTFSDGSGIFKVDAMALPPAETRICSKNYLGSLDLFAPDQHLRIITNRKYPKFKVYEKMDVEVDPDTELVVLSDVHLDQLQVFNKLKALLKDYETALEENEQLPIVFVLMGNFISAVNTLAENAAILTRAFEKLTDLISSFKRVSRCQFVFVPGPSDPAGSVINILPKVALPSTFTKSLQRLPKVQFTTNPARIRFCGQDIVLFREDLINRMRRHCVVDPVDDEEVTTVTQHLVCTLFDQGHLVPLMNRSIYWNYDYCMYLWPLPDVVILADKYDQFEHVYQDCHCFNPGSFSTDFSFIIYRPSEKVAEFSRINEN